MTSEVAPGLSPPPASAPERWRRIPLRWRVVLVVLAGLAVVKLASSLVTGLGGGPGVSGPSSSYDTTALGSGALAQLLAQRGHRVDRLTRPLGGATFPVSGTVFVLDPTSWDTSATASLRRVLAQGDHVILGGPPPANGVLRSLLGVTTPPVWQAEVAGVSHPVADRPEVADVQTVVATGAGTFATPSGPGQPVPLLRGPGGVLALVDRGHGTLVLLASSSPLHNDALGLADDAAFAVNLVAPGSPVVFDEYDHGVGRPGAGLAGLPASWRWGLGLALLAILVWILSASRRFGPPDRPGRLTVPPRVLFVDAMATLLSTRPTDQVTVAVDPVRAEARRRLCRWLAVPVDASDDVVRDRLSQAGDTLPRWWADAVLRLPDSAADVVAVGRALSELDRADGIR